MSLFIDASALVAMLAREPEAAFLSDRVDWEVNRIISPIAIWEATRGLANARGMSFEEARTIVADFLRDFAVQTVPIGAEEAMIALDAALLFKGDDFTHTDVRDGTLE